MISFLHKLGLDLRQRFSRDMTDAALTAAIIFVALGFIVLALIVHNKWIKAGILAYMVLP